jgi:hypothetical protein
MFNRYRSHQDSFLGFEGRLYASSQFLTLKHKIMTTNSQHDNSDLLKRTL